MMQGTENAAEHEDDGFQDDRAVGSRRANQAEAGKQQRDDGGGKDFEEAFDPQVDQPPAPVLDHRVVCLLTPDQRGGIEAADAHCSEEDHGDQAAALGWRAQSGQQGATKQADPDQQADEKQDLPDTAHAGVLQALIADPEAVVVAQVLESAQPTGDRRPGDDQQQGVEQHIDAQALKLRLAAGNRRRDVKAGCQPGSGDPQHGELGMDRATDGKWQNFAKRNAEEARAFDGIVCGDDTHADLREDQRDDHVEVLPGGQHRRRHLHVE